MRKCMGPDVFYDDAVNAVYPEAYEEAIKEAKITPGRSARASKLFLLIPKDLNLKLPLPSNPRWKLKIIKE